MCFQLTKKHDLLKKNIRSLAVQQLRPLAGENDRTCGPPYKAFDVLAKNRLLGLLVPREEGGEGAGFLDTCLVLEEISKECPVSALCCSSQNLGTHLLSKEGAPSQKEKFMAGLLQGKAIFGYILPGGTSQDIADVAASFSGENDHFVVNSAECFVMNGEEAELIVVFARKGESMRCFLIEKRFEGFSCAGSKGISGSERSATCKAVLNNCRVPAGNTLGQEIKGEEILSNFIHQSACFAAARALGIGEGALNYAVEYSKKREQFGRPIKEFQAIRAMLADMSAAVEASRCLTYKAGAALDERSRDRGQLSCTAKYVASKMAMEVTRDAIQVTGGYGYTREYPLEKMMRNALLGQVVEGSNHSHQLYIAKCLLGEVTQKTGGSQPMSR